MPKSRTKRAIALETFIRADKLSDAGEDRAAFKLMLAAAKTGELQYSAFLKLPSSRQIVPMLAAHDSPRA